MRCIAVTGYGRAALLLLQSLEAKNKISSTSSCLELLRPRVSTWQMPAHSTGRSALGPLLHHGARGWMGWVGMDWMGWDHWVTGAATEAITETSP